jgi:hypothetical protein
VIPATAVIRDGAGITRVVSFEHGWAVFNDERPGVLIAVCLGRARLAADGTSSPKRESSAKSRQLATLSVPRINRLSDLEIRVCRIVRAFAATASAAKRHLSGCSNACARRASGARRYKSRSLIPRGFSRASVV